MKSGSDTARLRLPEPAVGDNQSYCGFSGTNPHMKSTVDELNTEDNIFSRSNIKMALKAQPTIDLTITGGYTPFANTGCPGRDSRNLR